MAGLLVHEWLEKTGGSENVFERLAGMFPDAARFALWNDSDGRFTDVRESWLARTPLRRNKALALPLMPLAWRTAPTEQADWILASSHLFAHHVRFSGSASAAPKFVYAHTPARYVWVPELDGRGQSRPARFASSILKPLDRKRAQEPKSIAANSQFVADRIATHWNRESVVIYPPVDVERFAIPSRLDPADLTQLSALPSLFLLGVSRFVTYKRLDAVIEAGRVTGIPVVLAGRGPDEARLRALAAERHPGKVTFVMHPSTDLLGELYRRAAALVFAPIEDFGIIPVEAMAAGTPVLANAIGGASESVVDGVTGAHVVSWSGSSLREAAERALSADAEQCRLQAAKFSLSSFESNIRAWLRAEGVAV